MSYRRAGGHALAGRLAEHLRQRFPSAGIFFDVDSIMVGSDFATAIQQAVRSSQLLLVVVTPDWAAVGPDGRRRLDDETDWLGLELRAAGQLGVEVIPVVDPYATMPAANELPPDLAWFAHRQAFQLHRDLPFGAEMARLDSRLEPLLAPAAVFLPPVTAPVRPRRSGMAPGCVVALVVTIAVLAVLGVVGYRIIRPLLVPTTITGTWKAKQDLHGARLTVTQVAQLRGRVTYTLQIDNRRGAKVFALAPPTGGFSAFDDTRRPYEAYLSDTSWQTEVPSGEQRTTTLVLTPALPAGAKSVTLRFSHRSDWTDARTEATTEITGVPVPGRS